MENKTFCIQPFVNVTTRIQGQHNVCCNITKKEKNISNITAIEFFNSPEVKDMQESLLKGEKVKDCATCYFMESNNQVSHRKQYNKYYNLHNDQKYKENLEKLKLDKLKNPLYAEIHISNLCNLKCLTCNERDSSKFHAENKSLGISKDASIDYTKIIENKSKAILDVITPELKFLDIRGGETMLIPEIKEVLSRLPKEKTKNIILKIQTNGTIFPDDIWVNIFKKFKNTKVNISVDAYRNDNHYIRYPSQWEDICKTLNFFKDNNIKFIINTVLSNLNLLVLPRLLDWIYSNQYLNYLYILKDPIYYRYTNLPRELLEKSMTDLQRFKEPFVNRDTNITIENLISNLKKEHKDYDQQWQNFKKEITMRDNARKNSIFEVLPELKEYF
jgi:MoaA/NifB/PqqE/SkfB family radical SAM enzyme